jgi:cytidine deaminase
MRGPTREELELVDEARRAAGAAYAPYSRLAVGAALLCDDGVVVCGANVENASFGLTSCAERNAVCAAVAGGRRRFRTIAVHADAHAAPPCGACRQVLAEFAPDVTVVFPHRGEPVAATLDELLPARFVLSPGDDA